MKKPKQDFGEVAKDGFMWAGIFTFAFVMICKWLSGN